MKAVCLLLCLGLARHIAGNIFSRQYLPQFERFVDPQNYLELVQPKARFPQESLHSQEARYQEEAQHRRGGQHLGEDQHRQRNQRLQENQHQQENQHRQANQHQQEKLHRQANQHFQGSQQRGGQHAQQRQLVHVPMYPETYQRSQESQYEQARYPREGQYSQEQTSQENQYQQVQYQKQAYNQQRHAAQARHSKDSTERQANSQYDNSNSKSSESSEEKIQIRSMSEMYSQPMYADPDTPAISSQSVQQNAAYGDAIEWRGIRMSAGPYSEVTKKEDIARIFADAQKATKHVSEERQNKYHEEYLNVPKDKVEDAHLNATQLAQKYQYPLEKHTVTTDDGYQLTLFRIQKQMHKNARDVTPKRVVFLMHGLQGSADDFMLMGHQSLAYLLADEGMDVWLGNARGNKYSRHHASKHPAQTDFWMFSNDEIALHDLPAMIDYALMTSGQPKLHYIGYSQGTTNYFALVSARPEYNQKIEKMYALSPMVYMSNVRSPLVRMIAPNSKLYERLNRDLGKGQFKPNKELLSTMGGKMCEQEIGCKKVCSNVNFVMSGMNIENIDVAQAKIITGHLPAGGSTRQIKQYGQAAAGNEFRMYDYGAELNQKVYGDSLPPKYEMKKITSPVALYYSEHDWLAHPKDVQRLKSELPNVTDLYKVPVDHFNQMDHLFSKMAPEAVYKRLIESIKGVNNN